VLTIEPANIFFSTALHKEPLLYLAVGLAALGAALVWKRRRIYASVLLMAAGSLVATATATYVGWFLAAACLAVLLHASARQLRDRVRAALGLALLGTCVALLAIPAVSQRTQRELSALQQSQNKNANLHSRLGLGRVDFSTPAEIAVNLPKRMIDLILRPYPWQLDDTNQRLAVIETLFVLVLLAVLTRTVFVRRAGLGLLPPLAYPALFMWIAYSLAVANAGTGFRYRAQVIPLLIGMAFVLRAGTQGPPSHHAEAGGDALRASATRLGAR
jgi:hypothetical protein